MIAEALQREIAAWETLGHSEGALLKRAVLEHGRAYEIDREGSAQRVKGLLGDCFRNATEAVLDARATGEKLTYVEGFAQRGMLVHHAWVINEAGKVLELTWRDGGTECGHCHGGEIDPEFDEDDPATWDPETCHRCGGTGESAYEHGTLDDAEYYGIAVDLDTLIAIIRRRHVFGALNTTQDLDEILKARVS